MSILAPISFWKNPAPAGPTVDWKAYVENVSGGIWTNGIGGIQFDTTGAAGTNDIQNAFHAGVNPWPAPPAPLTTIQNITDLDLSFSGIVLPVVSGAPPVLIWDVEMTNTNPIPDLITGPTCIMSDATGAPLPCSVTINGFITQADPGTQCIIHLVQCPGC